MKFNGCGVLTNFLHLTFHNDNLTIDVVTQFSQFVSNLDIAYRTIDNACCTNFGSNFQRNAFIFLAAGDAITAFPVGIR